MKSTGVFEKELSATIGLETDVYGSVSDLLDMIDFSTERDTSYLVHDDTLYSQAMFDADFITWVYDRSDSELNSIKHELLQRIWRAESIGSEEELASVLDRPDSFSVGKPSPNFVWCTKDFLIFKQNRLSLISSKSEFGRELPECFENIFFDKYVPATLNTLQTEFEDIKGEIIYHLQKLDEFYEKLRSMRSGRGYDSKAMSQAFFEYSHIKCSRQAGRDGVTLLKRKYINSETKIEETLVCEMHTKFSTHNRSGKPDRIYFHPGKAGICEGKIIVIHIGEHTRDGG